MDRSSNRLFIDVDAFDEQHIVNPLRCRDEQLRQLRMSVAPAFRGAKPLHVVLTGPAGSGKTLVARHILNELAAKGVPTCYVNCMEDSTLYAVLDRISASHRLLQPERNSTLYRLEQIARFLKDRPFVLALDEVDRVPPKAQAQMLYSLAGLGKVGLVCISSGKQLLRSLDESIRSRLAPVVIECPPYSLDELRSIVLQRADMGMTSNACPENVAAEVARLAGGDARTAIHGLRRAAVNAGQRAADAVEIRDARFGWEDGAKLKREYVISQLNDHQRAAFRLLHEFGEMSATRLWPEYLAECERLGLRPVARRTLRDYMSKLALLGLIDVRKALSIGNVPVFRIVPLKQEEATEDSAAK